MILDGEGIHTGVGIAEMLAGAAPRSSSSPRPSRPSSMSLMGTQEVGFIVGRLKAAGVMLLALDLLRSIGDARVTVYDVFTEQERTIDDVDAVVLATSREPYDPLTDGLEGKVAQLFTIGDALAARPMAAATYEGQMFARFIGEPGAPTDFSEAYWPEPDPELLPQPAAVLLDR